jgi:hypothetical protein
MLWQMLAFIGSVAQFWTKLLSSLISLNGNCFSRAKDE